MSMPDEQAEVEKQCQALGRAIAADCPPGVGFALVIFTFEPGFSSYCSNAERPDMIRELRDCADRLQQGELPPMQWDAGLRWLEERKDRIFIRLARGGRGVNVSLGELVGEERAFHNGRLCERLSHGIPVVYLRDDKDPA